MTRWEFDRLVRTVWAFGQTPEPTVRVGLFRHVLHEGKMLEQLKRRGTEKPGPRHGHLGG